MASKKQIKKGAETRKKIYDFIKAYIQENTYPPSIREICEGTGLSSTNTVYTHLTKMVTMGAITMQEGKPRTIRLLMDDLIE